MTSGDLEALSLAKGCGKSVGLMRIGCGDNAVVGTNFVGCPAATWDIFSLAPGDRAVSVCPSSEARVELQANPVVSNSVNSNKRR